MTSFARTVCAVCVTQKDGKGMYFNMNSYRLVN